MKTQTMNVKIGGALKTWTSVLTLVTFLFVQLPSSFAQELAFEPQKLMPEQSIVSAPQPETPQIGQSSITAIQNAGKPLSLPANQEKKNAQPEIRGLDEYSFDEAIDQLQPGIASAVIVKKISSWGLRKLLELDIEVGIAVVHGKIVLFTSGEEDQIRMLPAARELLRNSSVIAHTHPGGAMPSAEDFLQAGSQTEYVISSKGIYAYNHNGLIYSKPLSFGYLVGKLNAARKPKASTKDTRDALNEFITSMDEYNEQPEAAVLFRSAITETNAPSNANFSFVRNDANFYLKNKITGELMFIATIGATESVPSFDVDPAGKLAVVNITGSSIPQGGKILIYDITRRMLVTAMDHLTGQLRVINGTVYDNCNCGRSTPYYFVDGLVLFNTRGLPVNGYTSTSGNFLNFTTSTFRTIQTPTFAFYGSWQDRFVLTPQKDKLIYAVGYDVIHASLMIYDLSTGVINGAAMPSSGFGGIKAVSSSGDYAIVASNLRDIYAVSLRTTQTVRYVSVTQLPGGTGYKLKTARFLNSTVAEGFLDNGERILLRVDATNFDIIQPARTIKAPSNANFSFRTVIKSTNDGFNIYLVNQFTGAVDFLASAGFKEELLYFDVDPTGKFALFNVFGSIHPKGGYVRIFNITQKLFVNPVNPAIGSVITINGILNANSNLASAFKFVDQFVVFAYHTLGYSEPGGGYILNLNKTPMWATSANVNIFEPVIMTPQKDRLLFGGSSGIGIYNVSTGAVNYQASGGISIRAVSPDGEFAIVGSVENKIYAVSIKNLSRATRVVTVPLQCNIAEYSCWSGRTAYALKSAIFLNPTLVEGILVNGKKIYLHVDAQRFDIVTSPSTVLTPNDIKPLPLNGVMQGSIAFPAPTFIAPTGAVSTGTLGDSRGHYFYYETKTPGWAGTGLTYDNFSTAAIETGDLSGVSQLTFGIMRGNPSLGFATKVKFEIVDNLNRKASVYLEGISDVEKVWSLPTLIFKNAGVDLTKVRVMYFIVEGQNQTGALQINRYPTGSVLPQSNLSTANITVLPGDPQKNHVAPPGADSSGAGTPRGMFLNYTTGTPGWAGGGYSYDNFSTTTIETGDISQYQNLRFGLKGDPSQVKFEVLDAFGHKTSIYLHGIRPDMEQIWSISTQAIASYGVDLTKIRWIYFIVEGQNLTGSLEINKVPAIAPSAAAITPLPATPRVVRVAPAGVTANVSTISRGARLDYNTSAAGWAGAGFSFDDPKTTTVESANLSSFSYLGFGLKGNPTQVKFELVDASGRKASVILTGISSTTEQRWSIQTSMFFGTGLDLTRITSIYFIVEGQNQSGSLEIYRM